MRLVRIADVLERLDRFRVTARHKVRPAEMTPESFGMIRVQPHSLLDPFDAVFWRSEPGQNLPLLDDHEVIVWVEAERALLMMESFIEILAYDVDAGKNTMDVAVVLIQNKCGLHLFRDFCDGFFKIFAPTIDRCLAEDATTPRAGVCVVRIERECSIHQAQSFSVRGTFASVMEALSGEHILIREHVFRRLALGAFVSRVLDPTMQDSNNRGGQFVLNSENILELAIVALGPDVAIGFSIDELYRNSHSGSSFASAAFQHILNARGGTLPIVSSSPFSLLRGVTRSSLTPACTSIALSRRSRRSQNEGAARRPWWRADADDPLRLWKAGSASRWLLRARAACRP